MKRIVKKTGFVRRGNIYTAARALFEDLPVKVDYEEEVDVPVFGIAEALKHIADGKKVLQLNLSGTGTEAGPFSTYTLPVNYTNHTKFILE